MTSKTGTLINFCLTNCHAEAAGVLTCDLSDNLTICLCSPVSNIKWDAILNENYSNKSYNAFLYLLKKCNELSFLGQEFKMYKK